MSADLLSGVNGVETMFVIKPKPTFKAEIKFPTPFGEAKFTGIFKHKGRKELLAMHEAMLKNKEQTDVDSLMEIMEGWEGVSEKFDRDGIEELFDKYPNAATAISEVYYAALNEGRVKN
jgi:hypothetical protein